MEYLEYLERRITFPALQLYGADLDLPRARGWDALKIKLAELSISNKARGAQINDGLKRIYLETITIGPRALEVYEVDESLVNRAKTFFSSLVPDANSSYFNAYPRPLTKEALENAGNEPSLCEVRTDKDSVTLIYCGRRLVEDRETRTASQIGGPAIKSFGWEDYDEFVLIKRRFVQSFEVARLDVKTRLLEIRVEEFPGVDTGTAIGQIKVQLNHLLANRFGLNHQLINSLNLFPAIKSIYSDSKEGVVVELGFTTLTGSAKHEKMRARKLDLREERFHVGGKAAIKGALTPFRLAVRWLRSDGHEPTEALLPGSIRQLSGVVPWLGHVIVKGSPSEADMRATVSRIVQHLPLP